MKISFDGENFNIRMNPFEFIGMVQVLADLDDDDRNGEKNRSRNMDVVILESSHRYRAVY